MKRIIPIVVFSLLTLLSCSKNNDNTITQANITFNFAHNWDGTTVTNSDFNIIKFTNSFGTQLSVSKLQYLVSNIKFENSKGETIVLDSYNLVDVTNNTTLFFSPSNTIPTGTYSKVTFTFGFNNEYNYQNYTDLNSVSWNVPAMLGGGYHFMQLEGKFIDNSATQTGYAYHTIRAVDNSGSELVFQDTFFEVNLGEVTITNNAVFNIKMNIAEWFKNPYTWNLNVLNNVLMPNFTAQQMMFQNGQNVFSLESINQ
ncbi:MAG: hypothetical protein ACI9OE_001563 [Mariniflexile sp.]